MPEPLPDHPSFQVDFAKHARPKSHVPSRPPGGAMGTAPVGHPDVDNPFLTTYQACNTQVHGDTKDTRTRTNRDHVVGYRGHVPQSRFEHGAGYQSAVDHAAHRVIDSEAMRSQAETTLRAPWDEHGPEDPGSTYRPRAKTPPRNAGGGKVVVSDGVEVVPYPAGYKGHVPGRGFEFGENFAALSTRLAVRSAQEKQRRDAAGEMGLVHPREIGAVVPEPPVYTRTRHADTRAPGDTATTTVTVTTANSSAKNIGFGGEKSTTTTTTTTTVDDGNDRLGETSHMRKLVERRQRQEARRVERSDVVQLTEQDEQVFSEPSYVRAARAKKEGPPPGYKIPGYSGHFGGKEFDLGQSYGERTRAQQH